MATRGNEVRAFSLRRLDRYFVEGIPFGIISAFRGENNGQENKVLSSNLAILIRELGLGYIKLLGGYVEHLDDGRPVDVVETSYLVPNIPRKTILRLGKLYEQEAILYFSGADLAYLDPRSGATLGTFHTRFSTLESNVATYFSQIRGKGRRFSFLQESALMRY